MEQLKLSEQRYLSEIAEIHEQELEQQYENYKKTTITVALRKEMIERGLKAETDIVLIEREHSQLIAFICARYLKQQEKVVVEILYVAKPYRHQGIAQSLKKEIELWAYAKGAVEIESTVANDNSIMQGFNIEQGYHIKKVIMSKRLTINNEDKSEK